MDSSSRYLCVELEDALACSDAIEIGNFGTLDLFVECCEAALESRSTLHPGIAPHHTHATMGFDGFVPSLTVEAVAAWAVEQAEVERVSEAQLRLPHFTENRPAQDDMVPLFYQTHGQRTWPPYCRIRYDSAHVCVGE